MLDDLTELPEGWSLETIQDLCEFNPKHNKGISDELEISFVPMPAVDEVTGTIREHEVKRFGEVKKGYTHFADRDVIFAKITPCMENGKVAIGQNLINGIACGSTEFHVLRSMGGVLPEYVYNFIRQPGYREIAQQSMSGAVGHQRVPKEFLLETQIPLPPLNEQKRIVAKIEELRSHTQAARNAIGHIPKLLEQFRQSVLAAAFRGDLTAEWRSENPDVEPAIVLLERIRKERRDRWEITELEKMRSAGKMPKDDKWKAKYKEPYAIDNSELPDLIDGWIWTNLSNVSECLDSIRIPINKEERDKRQGAISYYGANGPVGWIDSHLFDEPLVIVVEDETFLGRTKPFSYKITGKSWVNNHAHVLRPLAVDVDYLNYSLMFYPFIPLTSGTTGRRKLTQVSLMSAPYPLAPFDEQQQITKLVQKYLEKIDRIEQQYQFTKTELDRLDRSILAKAFKGELVPQDPTDEAAIVLLERIKDDRASQTKPAKTKRKKA